MGAVERDYCRKIAVTLIDPKKLESNLSQLSAENRVNEGL